MEFEMNGTTVMHVMLEKTKKKRRNETNFD